MNPFIKFMASPSGRLARIIGGIALIAWGWLVLGGTVGIIVALLGLVPLLAGLLDFCVFSPMFGGPFSGTEIRSKN